MTGRRISAARMAACGLTAAALLVTSACGGGKSHPAADAGHSSAGGAATSAAPPATPASVAQAFLKAWAAGDYAGAAALTDDAKDASTRLKAIADSLKAQKTTLNLGQQENVSASSSSPSDGSGATPGATSPGSSSAPDGTSSASGSAPAPAGAPAGPLARYEFSVSDDFGNNLVWNYQSVLDVVTGPAGTPVVHWSSAVINPQLGGTALLEALPPKASVVDRDGKAVDLTAHPTLAPAMNAIAARVPAGGTPTELTVTFVDPTTGGQIPGSQAWPLGAQSGQTSTVKTTIDQDVQSAIESALQKYPDSGMVAIQPSTGDILGMASNDKGFPSLAYKGARAPGSTFKVVTTALALQRGLSTSDTIKCTPSVTVEGKKITNDSGLANGLPDGSTLKEAFYASCNTAYVNLALDGKLGNDYSALSDEAKNYFGMNQKWDLGMGQATYGTPSDQQVPAVDGDGAFAREAFGQDRITMSPLTMASIAATVANNGVFKQPILVPGTKQITATPLPADVDSQLVSLMRGVVTNPLGTGYRLFPGISGVGAKTGSAESNDSATTHKTDSWMIVFDKAHDIAFGAVVLNGGFGSQASGPAIDTVMNTLGYH